MNHKKAFRIAFDFFERWTPCPDTPEEWVAAAREVGVISGQNGNDPFLVGLIITVYDEFDRRWKERNGEQCES